MDVTIIGWHIHPQAAKCITCASAATVVAECYDEDGFPQVMDLCDVCLDRDHSISADKVAEVFKELGF